MKTKEITRVVQVLYEAEDGIVFENASECQIYEKYLETLNLSSNVREWYIKAYPTDDLGKEIEKDVTFDNLKHIKESYEIYDIIEVADSVIRERVWDKLEQLIA